MSWEDQWPGTPYEPTGSGSPAASGPFRVALKPSACEAGPEIAALREETGEIVTFDTRAAAERALVDAESALHLQGPAPNDPATVDAYLVALRDPEPDPGERPPPAAGWTFDARPRQVGRLAEALFDAYARDPPPVVAYAARDLGVDPAEIRVDVDPDPSAVSGIDADAEVGDSGDASDPGWVPDVGFVVRRVGDGAYGAPVLARYVAEIKHGSSSFERGQRAAMARLAMRRRDLDVLVIRVDLEGMPRSYDVSIRALDSEN